MDNEAVKQKEFVDAARQHLPNIDYSPVMFCSAKSGATPTVFSYFNLHLGDPSKETEKDESRNNIISLFDID